MKTSHPDHEYHARMHDYAEELEPLLMMVLLVCFGGALVGEGLLQGLSWPAAAFSLIALLVVLPLSGWVGTMGSGRSAGERAVVSFFGIRGLGTIYYLAYALRHASFGDTGILWATASFTVLVSIVMHGTLVTPSLRRLDQAGRHQGNRTAT